MRRPTLCCDHNTTDTLNDTSCKDQGGTLARVRRLFFSTSLGRRTAGITNEPLKVGLDQQPPPSSSSLAMALPPPLKLRYTLATVTQEMIGVPLRDLVYINNTHGVPDVVYSLCSYILNHDVNCAPLLFEEWSEADTRVALSMHHCSKMVDSTLAPQLLRLYIQELPSPLIPAASTVEALMHLAEHSMLIEETNKLWMKTDKDVTECRARKLLSKELPLENLKMVRYLTAFMSCLHHANRCESNGASVLLGHALLGQQGDRLKSTILAKYLLLHSPALFPEDDSTIASTEDEDSSSTSTSSSTNTSSRTTSRTTTSNGEEDCRSPAVSPTRLVHIGHDYVLLPDDLVSPSEEVMVSPPEPLNESPQSPIAYSNQDDTQQSTNNCDLATGSISYSCELKAINPLLSESELLNRDASDTGIEESDGTSCPLSDPWEDLTTSGGEVYGGAVSSDDHLGSLGEVHLVGESRRFSERTFFPSCGDAQHNTSSPQRRSKKKKNKRKHSKDGGILWSSTDSREKLSCSAGVSGASEDEDTLVELNSNSGPAGGANIVESSLTSLLDHNEPVVACDRSRWSSDLEFDHRTDSLGFIRYADSDEDTLEAEPAPSWKNTGASSSMRPASSGKTSKHHRFDQLMCAASNSPSSSAFLKAVTGKSAIGALQKNISSLKRKIKKFEEEFEDDYGYKPSHSDKMKHRDVKKYVSDLNKYRKELKLLKEGVAEMMNNKSFSLSLLRCQESTSPSSETSSSSLDHKSTLRQVQDKLQEARVLDGRPTELSSMTVLEMQEEKVALQKALLYYESVHGRPNSRDTRELARPLYDRYRQVKRSVTRAQARAKENINELAPIIEHVAMDFTLASPQHRSSLVPDSTSVDQLLECNKKLMVVQQQQREEEEEEDSERGSDCSDVKPSSSALSNLHSLPLHELKERRKEARDQKKKLRKSLRQFEERYEKEHGHKLAKEDRGFMENTYRDYKHAKAKLRLLEALISKKAPKEEDFY